MSTPIRFAVIGARRGRSFIDSAKNSSDLAQLVAVCDLSDDALAPYKENYKTTKDFEAVLNDPDVDAVCIATPVAMHAPQAIAALKAGKHVLSEVTANRSLDEGRELIRLVRETGLTYMMAENYCFTRPVLCLQNMVEAGLFGEITFATGAYIHDCRSLAWDESGELTWRGQGARVAYGNTYPTHSLGPVARWLGINRTDKFVSTATWATPARGFAHWAQRTLPSHPEYADASFWRHNDSCTSLLRTQKGALVEIRVDGTSARPHHMERHEIQGTRGCALSQPTLADGSGVSHHQWLIWLEDSSPSYSWCPGMASGWEPLENYYDRWDHPLWRAHLEEASLAGHGGGDYFVLREFCRAIREGRPPLFDVVDAVTWSSLTPLSVQSLDNGSTPVDYPDFTE